MARDRTRGIGRRRYGSGMARRRDARRYGPGPYVLGLRRNSERWSRGFPYDVPAIDAVDDLDLSAPVTLLSGDNGSGKSTLIEAIGEAIGFASEGGELERSGELPAVPRPVLDGALEPRLSSTKPRKGYFLRAESFFNIARFIDSDHIFAPDLSLYGDVPLHEQSHGQSFLALAANRFGGEGLYILDEPEAALSVPGRSRCSPSCSGAPARERSSSSPPTRRSCSRAPMPASTSSTTRASRSAATTSSTRSA